MRNAAYPTYQASFPGSLSACLTAGLLVAFSFWLQGDIQINLSDEGFLWYGTWRTSLGEIPFRDFKAYFPGRYYWTAGWSLVFGDGIMGLRASVALFQAMGLAFGLLALRRVIRLWWLLLPAGLLLLLWMHPRHKLFAHALSLAAVYFALLLLENPSLWRHFVAGVFSGLTIFFGMNHGLYCVVSFFFLILLNWYKTGRSSLSKKLGAWGTGLVVGSLPLLFMLLFVSGFFDRVVELVQLLFGMGQTNLPLAVPWPWKTGAYPGLPLKAAGAFSLGAFFILVPAFYLAVGLSLLGAKKFPRQTALLAASFFVGVPYLHHAFARADLAHLSQAIPPFIIGALALPFTTRGFYRRIAAWIGLGCVFAMSVCSVGVKSPFLQKTFAHPDRYVAMDVRGDRLWLQRHIARIIQTAVTFDAHKIAPGESLLLTGHWPALYPILGRKSPLRDFYLLRPATEQQQRRQISALEEAGVDWVLMSEETIDDREDLRLRNTHALLWKYFQREFTPVAVEGLPKNYWFVKRNQAKDF